MDNTSKNKEDINDTDKPPPQKGGLKFAPKVPHKKDPKIVRKMEIQEESKDYTVGKDLMMKLRTSQSMDDLGNKAKAEKKEGQTQVTFGEVNSLIARSFPTPRSASSDSNASAAKLPKEYVEPWDYTHTNYPVTLPIRRPYSGNPAILDEEEFGQSSSNGARDGELTAAEALGLMARMNKPELIFFQLPVSLPLPRAESVTEEDTFTNDNFNTERTTSQLNDRKRRHQSIQGCKLKELPDGLMGKMLVYRSGKVEMKLGDALFDVSAGSECTIAQEVVAINTKEKHCCSLGEISRRAIVTPDVDYLLDSIEME